ncbi:hypothetical protein [Halorubellus litoreus]|uniref:Major facilitator superfamily (MFS) profile domain-containing protein n=1 Tax=Halorubellus litoreus TaxID=755308 RepID=A0ABD5VIQ7_9EURY
MNRLRLLGFLGSLLVALGGVGSLAAFGLRVGEFRPVSTGAVVALVALLAVGVVALGWTGARTKTTRYW